MLEIGHVSEEEIGVWIQESFGFIPYSEELKELINKLLEDEEIERFGEGEIRLSQDAQLKYGAIETKLKDREKMRFENFSSFILENSEDLPSSKLKLLWSTFIEYLYNNFYDYGEEALKRLHPHIFYDKTFDKEEDYMQTAAAKLDNKELIRVFKLAVEQFPDFASSDDLDFLSDLTQKTLSFASLGMDPKLAEISVDLSLIDWVLYLDTNVLYSLLNLHSHPENEACKALIKLINDNKEHLKISLRYSELTKKELNAKRADFDLLDDKLTDSGIRAVLKSEDLDDFSREFYQNLLENREGTIHPAEVIDLSSNLLDRDEIAISRNAKRVENIGENYIRTHIQDYQSYITKKNLRKEEFCNDKKIRFFPIFKSDKQITHDITLRELLLNLRSSIKREKTIVSFNSLKYFGVTLDGLLRDYDTKMTKDYDDERSFPVFFRPSYLLSKLVKVLPIVTDDYKKAFIKAVTSKGFNKDVRKSHDILRVVNYLKSQGIDDEQVVYNMITEDIFLEKYKERRKASDFNEQEFFESELNRELKAREHELEQTKNDLKDQKIKTMEASDSKAELEGKKESLEVELELYSKAIKKLNLDLAIAQKAATTIVNQSQIDFEGADARLAISDTQQKLKIQIQGEIDAFKKRKFSKWRKVIWWNLLWVIPIISGGIWVILYPDTIFDAEMDSTSIRVILGLLTLSVGGIFVYLIKSRYFDEGNKQKKMENIKPPKELLEKLENL